MGRMKDYNLWLEETGKAHWCRLTNAMVFDVDANDPKVWEEYLESCKPQEDKGKPCHRNKDVVADDGEDDDSCESSGYGVLVDDGENDEYWFEADGGLTGEAWDYLADSDANGEFI